MAVQAAVAEVVFVGGQVVRSALPTVVDEAVAWRDGRILAIGSRRQVEAVIGPQTRVVELEGATVVPGLVDAHGHVLSLGFSLRRVSLRDTVTYDQLINRVAKEASQRPADSWIFGRGWDQTMWPEAVFPHHLPLSTAVPDHPVVLERVDGHAVLVNQAALQRAGITAATPDPAGGRILRDEDGEPTGVLVDNAAALLDPVIPTPNREEQLDALERAVRHLASLGLTAVHDAGTGYAPSLGLDDEADPGWHTIDLYRELLARQALPIRIYAMLGGNGAYPGEAAYFSRPPVVGEGDGMLTVRAIKLGADGALGSRGAALEEAYSDEPGHRGLETRSQQDLDRLVGRAHREGWQVAIHAIGDRANRMALDAFASARGAADRPGDTRPRIEHAQVLRPLDVARFADVGVIASVQPSHATSDRRWAGTRIGAERLAGAYAYRSLLQAGAAMACGSDFPVESANPLAGLQAAVARTDADGAPQGGWRPEERLTAAEALACFTSGAAWAAFMEGDNGSLEVGMRADLTVLSGDPLTTPPGELVSLRVLRTVVGGRTVHELAR